MSNYLYLITPIQPGAQTDPPTKARCEGHGLASRQILQYITDILSGKIALITLILLPLNISNILILVLKYLDTLTESYAVFKVGHKNL